MSPLNVYVLRINNRDDNKINTDIDVPKTVGTVRVPRLHDTHTFSKRAASLNNI